MVTPATLQRDPEVIVIGTGPNGLTAAAILAQAGLRVLVLEANSTVGGAVRTGEVTLPGFRHDLYSGFYPLFPVGPIGRLPLEQHGLSWCNFEIPFAGGRPDGAGVAVARVAEESAQSFENACAGDGARYLQLWQTWQRGGPAVLELLFNPLGSPAALISARKLGSVQQLLNFAQDAIAPAEAAASRHFVGQDARIWFIASPLHSDLGTSDPAGGMYGLVMMGLAQKVGMPVPKGGAQAISEALRRYIESLGGMVLTGSPVTRVIVRRGRVVGVRANQSDIRATRAVLATVPPTQLIGTLVSPESVPSVYLQLVKRFRWGSGVFKLDLALRSQPRFSNPALNGAGVLHLGRSVEDLRSSTHQVSDKLIPDAPPLIAGVHTLADPSRAPAGCHTLWVETHVPGRPEGDARNEIAATDWSVLREPFAERLIDELDRFIPNVRDQIMAYHAQTPADLERSNANLVEGDIAGGSFSIDQQLIFRPFPGWFRHTTPIQGLYLGGASAHPGGGVHGGAGANAARVLLGDLRLADLLAPARDIIRSLRRLRHSRS